MKRKIPLMLLCLLFLGIAGYAGTQLYLQWREYRAGEKAYEELARYVQPASRAEPIIPTQPREPTLPSPAETTPQTSPQADDTLWPTVDFSALQDLNPDIVAWICLEGTGINYPVVQGTDNEQYLYTMADGTANRAGSIFMDYRNSKDLSGRHTVLYGHHMQNGTMFKQITEYKDQAFYDAHPYCLIMTPEGSYKLEFFAGYTTNLNSNAWKLEFGSDGEFEAWLEQAAARSTFQSNIRPTSEDRVITLSTCTYEYNDARYVLVGILTAQG